MAPLFTGLARNLGGYGFGRSAAAPVPSGPSGITATGGTTNTYSDGGINYKSHVFTASGAFTISALSTDPAFPNSVEYLVVASGGGGGASGGGAGGLLVSPAFPGIPTSQNQGTSVTVSAPNPYPIVIGAGGASGSNGNVSSFDTISATGGGGGPPVVDTSSPGGSGSGVYAASPYPNTRSGGSATNYPGPTQQGFPGGSSTTSVPNVSGYGGNSGGGGAGGVGGNGARAGSAAAAVAGNGGIGLQVLIAGPPASPQPVGAPGPGGGTGWFAGGAGGYKESNSGADDSGKGGGSGGPYAGGGNGGNTFGFPTPSQPDGLAQPGTVNTGGGGGSIGYGNPAPSGGSGGSGIVVVRYQIAASQL